MPCTDRASCLGGAFRDLFCSPLRRIAFDRTGIRTLSYLGGPSYDRSSCSCTLTSCRTPCRGTSLPRHYSSSPGLPVSLAGRCRTLLSWLKRPYLIYSCCFGNFVVWSVAALGSREGAAVHLIPVLPVCPGTKLS